MSDAGLESVSGLQEAHRRALAGKLEITSVRALADADQRAVYGALANLRPRPSLARVAQWQEDARNKLTDAEVDRSDWHTAASFAVVFAQRQVGADWEYRLEAERTEVEPASESRAWAGWNCEPLCAWMLGHVRPAESPAAGPAAHDAKPATTVAPVAPARTERRKLHVDSATIIDAERELDLIRAGTPIAAPTEDLRAPVRLRLTVSGGRSDQQLRAAIWFLRPSGPGWSPHDPVSVSPDGQAEFDLSPVPSGSYDIRLLAWATDPGATLAAVTLPTLTLRHDE